MSKVNNQDKFNFFVPAEFEFAKGKDGQENGLVKIKGIASSSAEDSDLETLIPSGFDYSYFLNKGIFNYNHKSNSDAGAIVGEPTYAAVVNDGKDFYVEGVLYPNEQGGKIAKQAQIFEKYSPNRRWGFSIEGQAIERGCAPEFFDNDKKIKNPNFNPDLWKKIIKARITNCAITISPKNPNTLMSLVKGEYSDALVEEDEEEENDIEKEMSAESTNILAPEDVEHSGTPKKKTIKNLVGLTKSQVFEKIVDRYEIKDFVFINKIYNFVKSIKDNDMVNSNTVTPETLEKALNFLDAIAKGESSETVEAETTTVETTAAPVTEDLTKSEEYTFAKSLHTEGKSKEECIEGMIRKGFGYSTSVATIDAVIAAAPDTNTGASLLKAEDVAKLVLADITKSLDNTIGQSLNPISEKITKGFGAVNDLFKSQAAENELLKGQLNTLSTRLEAIEKTPLPSKTVRNVASLDKFAKSENGDTPAGYRQVNIHDKIEKGNILNELDSNFDLAKSNQEKEIWGSAMRDVEAVGLSALATNPVMLQRLKIQLVQG